MLSRQYWLYSLGGTLPQRCNPFSHGPQADILDPKVQRVYVTDMAETVCAT